MRNFLEGDFLGVSVPTGLVPLAAYLASDARLWKAVLLWGVIAIYTAAIYVSLSRGGMLGLLAVVILLCFRSKRASLRI